MLHLKNIAISRGATTLIEHIHLDIFEKHVIGFIGANGCGKSSLLAAIKGEMAPLDGDIESKSGLLIGSLAQEVEGSDITALHYVLSGDTRLFAILTKLQEAEANEDYETVTHCHSELYEIDGYSSEARASKILVGLGFSHEEMQQSVQSFSGGWRMRLSLAKCLFTPSELLLLDEPTNHLDMEAIMWLEQFLNKYPGAILIVSHDRDFLDHTVTHIAHVHQKRLKLYKGDYSGFETLRAQEIATQKAHYKKQQAQISHMMAFVDRYRAKATKARQAQSRLKAIEKMALVKPVHESSSFHFHFKKPDRMPNPMVSLQHADLGYDETVVLKKINISLMAGQRLGLLGVNGAGKSTLIKGICGEISPMKGKIVHASGTQIGYFAQHQVDAIDLEQTPLSLLRSIANGADEKTLLSYLGSFGFGRDQSNTVIRVFSGGEKARVALLLIIWQKPNLLLLDEPTNHLDLEMREALSYALQEYEGALLLVSHDRYLLRTLVDDLYLVHEGHVDRFDGTVEEYHLG